MFNNKNSEKKSDATQEQEAKKFELIEDALLENVSGGRDDEMCIGHQFCEIPPDFVVSD